MVAVVVHHPRFPFFFFFSFFGWVFFSLLLSFFHSMDQTMAAARKDTEPKQLNRDDRGASEEEDKLLVLKTKSNSMLEVFAQFASVTGRTSSGSAKVMSTHCLFFLWGVFSPRQKKYSVVRDIYMFFYVASLSFSFFPLLLPHTTSSFTKGKTKHPPPSSLRFPPNSRKRRRKERERDLHYTGRLHAELPQPPEW